MRDEREVLRAIIELRVEGKEEEGKREVRGIKDDGALGDACQSPFMLRH